MSDKNEQEQRESFSAIDQTPLWMKSHTESTEFGILPHPAKTNNPADLQDPATQGGLQSSGTNVFNAKGPHVPSQEIAQGLEAPKSRDEVRTPLVSSK